MSDPASRLSAALAALQGHYPREIELSLGRIEYLLERLGNPQHSLPPTIHVAGTNGKGSTCAFLRAMAEAAGLSVHVFTSPHLVRFNERVRLAGNLISDTAFAEALERVRKALNTDPITHFEATTAAALLAFSETPADLLILEVGLGGRYDATNVIPPPAVAVISPVDYDHKQFLGEDLKGIAGEKAGIIKPGTPVVTAIQAPEVSGVIEETAKRQGAPLHPLAISEIFEMPEDLALLGGHQRANAALAAKALKLWGNPAITQTAIWQGARRAVWPARMQRLAPGPVTAAASEADVWLDGGHNPHAARAVADLLSNMSGQTHLVTAMMASKDANGFFDSFRNEAPKVFTCPNSEGHHGAEPAELAAQARAAGLQAEAFADFDAALAAAAADSPARILICGSLYLAGDVLRANLEIPE
ncbi:MAG: bifunctional folylpolyglutamate synthase/dihydrofolate synthase [Hyphomonadaceae bacterium]|nr:bifunctional folylpolyglutamate synthase/dihydrofolate synthase [Hyphomonadaceae bacterium]